MWVGSMWPVTERGCGTGGLLSGIFFYLGVVVVGTLLGVLGTGAGGNGIVGRCGGWAKGLVWRDGY